MTASVILKSCGKTGSKQTFTHPHLGVPLYWRSFVPVAIELFYYSKQWFSGLIEGTVNNRGKRRHYRIQNPMFKSRFK